jgi:hypothetical protein
MSAISKVLVQQSQLEIFSCTRKTCVDLKGWVANQGYFVDSDLESNRFILRAADTNYLRAAYANDCNRMAMAAIESAAGIHIDPAMKKSGAWGIIRAYYAAFFAAHSIMRMFGISCSQLEQPHVDKIYELAKLVGKVGSINKLEKGFYSIETDKNTTNVSFFKYKDSHRDTWARFLALLEFLKKQSSNVSALSKYRIEAIDILTSIKRGITRSHCGDKGNWLSFIRNSVNYQQSHGVWFPYERKPIAPLYLGKMANEWTRKPEDLKSNLSNSDIETFFEVVLMVLSLFRELLIGCFDKVGLQNSVFTNGSLRLLNNLHAA